MSPRIEAILRSAPWDDIHPRLCLIAFRLLRKHVWRGIRGGHVPSGLEAADFVNRAIEKTLDGTRYWDPSEQELFDHLVDVMRSDISGESKKKENVSSVVFGYFEDTGSNNPYYTLIDLIEDENSQSRIDGEHFVQHLKDFVKNNHQDLLPIFLAISDHGMITNVEISQHLDCTPSDVSNLKKRLKRAMAKLSASDLRIAGRVQ